MCNIILMFYKTMFDNFILKRIFKFFLKVWWFRLVRSEPRWQVTTRPFWVRIWPILAINSSTGHTVLSQTRKSSWDPKRNENSWTPKYIFFSSCKSLPVAQRKRTRMLCSKVWKWLFWCMDVSSLRTILPKTCMPTTP